jgi:hypothetical protein
LAERAFVGLVQQTPARLNVIGCGYTQVTVAAELVPRDIRQVQKIRQQALIALNAFFHPITGGIKGKGWEFGRDVYASEIYYLLEQVLGVDHVNSLRLLPNQYQAWLHFQDAPVTTIDLPIGSLVRIGKGGKSAILAASIPKDTKLDRIAVKSTSISVGGFATQDQVEIVNPDDIQRKLVTGLRISKVTPIDDIVYLEDNFLIYPGAHQITMVNDTTNLGRK